MLTRIQRCLLGITTFFQKSEIGGDATVEIRGKFKAGAQTKTELKNRRKRSCSKAFLSMLLNFLFSRFRSFFAVKLSLCFAISLFAQKHKRNKNSFLRKPKQEKTTQKSLFSPGKFWFKSKTASEEKTDVTTAQTHQSFRSSTSLLVELTHSSNTCKRLTTVKTVEPSSCRCSLQQLLLRVSSSKIPQLTLSLSGSLHISLSSPPSRHTDRQIFFSRKLHSRNKLRSRRLFFLPSAVLDLNQNFQGEKRDFCVVFSCFGFRRKEFLFLFVFLSEERNREKRKFNSILKKGF